MTEAQIQKAVISFLEKKGAFVVKTIACSKAGVPDILCCLNGKFIGVEVKSERGKPTKLQLFQLAKIEEAGGLAFVAKSVLDVKEKLEDENN